MDVESEPTTTNSQREPSSFRDPSGHLFLRDGVLLRQVNRAYGADFDRLLESGLYAELVREGLIVRHEERPLAERDTDDAIAVLRPDRLTTISYPYEWCFGQLKDAALATLELQKRALAKGMVLKDASAYNIQFQKGKPVLIDTLSFETYREGTPWVAYRQFCQHFLGPLALAAHVDPSLIRLLALHLDGVPLALVSKTLPKGTRWRLGLGLHIHAHAKAQKSGGERKGGRTAKIGKAGLLGLVDSLESTVRGLRLPNEKTLWSNYYGETNYTDEAMAGKRELVDSMLAEVSPAPCLVWDLGANTGEFSKLALDRGASTVAWDLDHGCVEAHWRAVRQKGMDVLPLVLDLTNPSPSIGWACTERRSFLERGPVDCVLALALVHHLAIGNNVPLERIADLFANLSPNVIVEFVSKEDSQTQRLLASRADVFPNYDLAGFEKAFSTRFSLVRRAEIPGTSRTLFHWKAR